MALYLPFKGCSLRVQLPCPALPLPPHLSSLHAALGLPQPRSLGGWARQNAAREEGELSSTTALCAHSAPRLCPFSFNRSVQGPCGEPTAERRRSRGAGELLTCAHPRGGGAGARRGRGAGPALLRSLPRGLEHLRAGRCERRPRRDGGCDPRPGPGAHRAAAAEPLPRRWEPRARADAEPRGAGVGTGGGGENFGASGSFHGAAPRRESGGSLRCARHRPALPLRDAPAGK